MKRILVINDSKFERKVFTHILTKLGHEVVEAEEFEAYNKLNEFKPEVIVVNLVMEMTTGDQMIKVFKSKFPKLKAILSSCSDIKLKDYKEQKVDAVLQTPLKQEDLKKVLASLFK